MGTGSYEIKHSFYAENGTTILTLDREIPFEEYRYRHIRIGNEVMPYFLATEGPLIAVKGEHNYTGQTLTLVE